MNSLYSYKVKLEGGAEIYFFTSFPSLTYHSHYSVSGAIKILVKVNKLHSMQKVLDKIFILLQRKSSITSQQRLIEEKPKIERLNQ